MAFVSYSPVDPIYYDESHVLIDDNQLVGYKWYQSQPYSDIPYQVSNPNFYQFSEYTPPPIPTHLFHSAEPLPPPSSPYIYTPPFTLTCHTTLSTGQPYYALETTALVTSTTASKVFEECPIRPKHVSHSPEPPTPTLPLLDSTVNSAHEVFAVNSGRESIYIGEKLSDEGLSNASIVSHNGSSAAVIGIESSCNKLANNFDDSFVMDNLLIHQNSSSITEYVEDFMHVKNRAEFIFKSDFDDDLLAYCFVEGLKEEIREAVELWAPRTLQEAIYLAKFQESLLEESVLVDNIEIKLDMGRKELDSQVERKVGTTTNCVNEMSIEVCKLVKQIAIEEMPWIILAKMEESLVAFIDMADKRVILSACVNVSQKQRIRYVNVMHGRFLMQIMNEPTSITNTYGLDKKPNNIAGEEAMLIFDPGGGVQNGQRVCVLKFFKELIKNEDVKLGEITMLSVASASGNLGEFKPYATGCRFLQSSNLHYGTTIGGDTITKVVEWKELVETVNVLLVTSDVHTYQEISLKFFTGKQLLKEHLSLGKKLLFFQNEVNRVAADFFIARLLLKLNVSSLLASIVKYSNMVNFFTLVVPWYFPLPNNCDAKTELKRLSREGIWTLILFGSAFIHGNEVLKLQVIYLSARELVKMLASLVFCTKHVFCAKHTDIGVPCDKQGCRELSMLWLNFRYKMKAISEKFVEEMISKAEKSLDTNFYLSCDSMVTGESVGVNFCSYFMHSFYCQNFKMLLQEYQDCCYLVMYTICQAFNAKAAKLDNNQNIDVTIVKRLILVWYWSVTTLVYDPENYFSCGVTLVKPFGVTKKKQGKITDSGDGGPRKLQRYVLLKRLDMHHDSNYLSWSLEKRWKDHTTRIWPENFGSGISEPGECGETLSNWTKNHNYLVSTNVKRLASAWYWNVTKLVFDPGGWSIGYRLFPSVTKLVFDPGGWTIGYRLFPRFTISHILVDKDILRGMDCNQLDITGPVTKLMFKWASHKSVNLKL